MVLLLPPCKKCCSLMAVLGAVSLLVLISTQQGLAVFPAYNAVVETLQGYSGDIKHSIKYVPTGSTNSWLQRRQVLQNSSDVRKVVLFAYMHGGSTLLHEMFNQDRRTIAWFEPLSPVYGHMYGLPENRNYWWIVKGGPEQHQFYPYRAPSLMEINHIVEFFDSIYSCSLDTLPREVLTNRFLMLNKALKPFAMCILKFRSQKQTLTKAPTWEHECLKRHGIDKFCGDDFYNEKKLFKRPSVDDAQKQKCYDHLEKARQVFKDGQLIDLSTVEDFTGDRNRLLKFYHNELCMHTLQERAKICLEETKSMEKCNSRSIRTAKILRLKMPYIEPLIQAVPDLFIVYYVRDPRAIAASRHGKQGPNQIEKWAKSVINLCEEMGMDLEAFSSLKVQYPGVFSLFRYEDLVEKTQETYENLFKSIQMEPLIKTYEWLQGTLHATENKGVQRVNASQVVNRWRGNFPKNDIKNVSNHSACKQLLNFLGYR